MRFFVFVLLIFMCAFSCASIDVHPEILNKFDSGETQVEIVVAINRTLSAGPLEKFSSMASSPNDLIRITVNETELATFLSDENVVEIEPVRYFKIYLGDSVNLINATPSWNLKVSNINLTGYSRSVCVIDTGINYSHPDLLGRNLTACNLDCIDKVCAENCSIEDLNGHGTHVAGIIGASGRINGIATGVGFIGLKVFPGALATGATSIGVVNAINWCVDNAETYNISVISMSFGTDTLYSSACDSNFTLSFTPAVNAAFNKNISIVAATGNNGNFIGIGAPACLSKVIAVGGADKSGGMYVDGNRNSLVQLLGIATNINSTRNTGGYTVLTGTSMATPMVSGAIAIVSQFLNMTSRKMNPLEIESVFDTNGFPINDSAGSGLVFSRIDVYSALLSLDNIAPNVSLISPVNNNINLSSNQSFSCNASDWQLANVTFRIWNSSGVYYNETRDLSGTTNETSFDLNNLPKEEYVWNCFVEDVLGNFGNAAANFSLTIGEIVVDLNSPVNESYTNVNVTNFSCVARTDVAYELANISFRIWNSSGDLIRNENRNISGLENTTNFSYTFLEEDDYLWECIALNNNSDVGNGVNFSIEYDVSLPVISDLNVDASTSSAVISWTTDEVSNSSVWMSGGTWSNSSDYATNHSVSVSGLSSSTGYTYVVRSCDRATNCVNSSGSFMTDAQSSSGGGGGGSSSGVKVIEVRPEEIFMGKSFLIGVNDKISFNLPSGSHSLTVSKVGKNYAEIVVMSEPLNLNLSVREEVKLNLSSSNYYDLIIRLNGISNRKANVSVMRIFEIIEVPEVLQKENDTSITPISPIVRKDEIQDFYFYKLLFVALVIISGGVIFWVLKSNKEDRLARKNARIRERARRKMRKEKDEELKKELKRLGLKV